MVGIPGDSNKVWVLITRTSLMTHILYPVYVTIPQCHNTLLSTLSQYPNPHSIPTHYSNHATVADDTSASS